MAESHSELEDGEWHVLDGILLGDLQLAKEHLASEDSQFWRRTYCRCLLTLFEGIAASFKTYTLAFYQGMLSDKEKKTLAGRQGALEGARIGLDLFTDVAGASTPLTADTEEWHVMKKAIVIRNRITHPEASFDLEISDSDLHHLRCGEEVISGLFSRSLEATAKALLKSADSIDLQLQAKKAEQDAALKQQE